jgi:hypothetical protein
MFLKLKKIALASALIIFTVAWFTVGLLENTYVYYPRSPRPEEGKTVPHEVKGIVVYITEEEQRLLSWLVWIEIGSATVAVLVMLIHRGDPFRSK